jgi:hypothetical protein
MTLYVGPLEAYGAVTQHGHCAHHACPHNGSTYHYITTASLGTPGGVAPMPTLVYQVRDPNTNKPSGQWYCAAHMMDYLQGCVMALMRYARREHVLADELLCELEELKARVERIHTFLAADDDQAVYA